MALQKGGGPGQAAGPHRGTPPPVRLTPREEEISLLVAGSLTNKRIASELSISGRTVENHVRDILRKLGLSRQEISSWVREHRPENPE